MKQFFLIALVMLSSLASAIPPHAPNRGLDHFDFFYAGESTKHRMYIVQGGQIAWSYFDPDGRGEISDAVLLSDGHILMAHQHGIREIIPTPDTTDGGRWRQPQPDSEPSALNSHVTGCTLLEAACKVMTAKQQPKALTELLPLFTAENVPEVGPENMTST